MRRALLMAAMIGLPHGAEAEGARFLKRDPACVQVATVQFLDCTVQLAFRCPAVDGETAAVFRDETYNADGLDAITIATADGALIESAQPGSPVLIRGRPEGRFGTPNAQVLAEGKGESFVVAELWIGGLMKPLPTQMTMRVTDQTVNLGDYPAKVMDIQVDAEFPPPAGQVLSSELGYLIADPLLSIGGETLSGPFYDPNKTPHRPLSVAFPGAPEFVTTTPAFCGPDVS
jgi:hypothetical protein